MTPHASHCEAPLAITAADRDQPGEDFIACMRGRFQVEREMDLMLTRKLQGRAGPPYPGASLPQMTSYLSDFLRDTIGGSFRIDGQRWFSGGASKVQMGCTLHRDGTEPLALVVRMEPAESVNSTSRAREYELLRAFEGVVPVPRALWVDADARWFPQPALITSLCAGVTKPTAATSGRFAGNGTTFGPALREVLAPQFIDHLAAIHRFDVASHELASFDRAPRGSTESARRQLDRARRIWEEDRTEDIPLLEVAANWLARELPVLDHVSVVHGDYRSGNFLFDESTQRITAVLDWERVYLGDRHRDLAWTAHRAFGCMAEDGRTFLVSGLTEPAAFFERYERLSGLAVDPVRLRWYTVLNSYQLAIAAIATGSQVVRLGKTHQDILLASVEPVGHGALEDLRRTLEELI